MYAPKSTQVGFVEQIKKVVTNLLPKKKAQK